ncbi:hypothetical protein BN381_600025 [Candidatus Microthrix parvicella RN1]|uniref:Uncharacterized protein n=1 Tax=Candidatus Neomicrothrix parvicella RN1 TaxID=1229780 RepID=R4Z6C7_9ACTN|nr:hypothetical protein BN381_600025 [Candidatus Microthrix parvicella RN1]
MSSNKDCVYIVGMRSGLAGCNSDRRSNGHDMSPMNQCSFRGLCRSVPTLARAVAGRLVPDPRGCK